MPATVRAIDVGYSWTKFTIAGDRADLRCRAYPSIAPRASGRDLALDGVSQRQTVQIPVDGLLFEVGPEATLVQETVHALPLDDAYTQTPEDLALVGGALRLMHVRLWISSSSDCRSRSTASGGRHSRRVSPGRIRWGETTS